MPIFDNSIRSGASSKKEEIVPEGLGFGMFPSIGLRTTEPISDNGPEFTASFWVYLIKDASTPYSIFFQGSSGTMLFALNQGAYPITVNSSSGQTVFFGNASTSIKKDAWYHVLISMDTSSPSKCHCYLNDIELSVTQSSYNATNFPFNTTQAFCPFNSGGTPGKYAHLFFDTKYRDLSIESNRRLFITERFTPTKNQSAQIPEIYLPMQDGSNPGNNLGSLGDFSLTNVAVSSLEGVDYGPNEYNSFSSLMDSTFNVKNISSLGTNNSKTCTCSFWYRVDTPNFGTCKLIKFGANDYTNISDMRFEISSSCKKGYSLGGGSYSLDQYNSLEITFKKEDGTDDFVISSIDVPNSCLYWTNVCFTVNMETQDFKLYINGELNETYNVSGFSDSNIKLNDISFAGFAEDLNNISNVGFSDFYFSTGLVDIEYNNPFIENGKPIFIGKYGEVPTGQIPEIYMPFNSYFPKTNMGSLGDFDTGGIAGSYRSPSDTLVKTFDCIFGNNLKRNSNLENIEDSKQFSFCCSLYIDTNTSGPAGPRILNGEDTGFNIGVDFNKFHISFGTALNVSMVDDFPTNAWVKILMSFDLTDANKRHIYLNNVEYNFTYSTYNTNGTFTFSNENTWNIGNQSSVTDGFYLGNLWFNTEYIDFSEETNRRKFFDNDASGSLFIPGTGRPMNLGEDGSKPTGNIPLLYFSNEINQGINRGNGGDFGVIGQIIDSSYITPFD